MLTLDQSLEGKEAAMSRILPQLPLEIIIDILSRLPVKPLFRFKCVYHDAYCNGDNVVTRELNYPDSTTETADELEFIGSCNGLIAVALNSDSHITIWNPTTGDSRALPASDLPMSGEFFSGFGYDSVIDDYKVVRGAASTSGSEIKMEVFNLKADKWRSIKDLQSNIYLNGSSISVNGFLHWLVPVENDPNPKLGIISFDLVEEKFLKMVEVPDDVTQKLGSNSLRIQRVGENLCICTDWYGDCYEAWIMKRDGREISWRKLYSFSSDPLPGCKYWLEVLWVGKNGNVVFDLDGRELVVYNPEEESSSQYDINWDGFEAITYMETLISPN
ncbi:F-box/kelch-repeat protein At3g06240-like isoform X2 [Euphorbia lathyris]|uniref:F-box/kelch-repeat protein At3g06240-like isoform X2 n=1 Tax=Euphorbia lathyris TaxID=212925 RepID=UPI003313F256